VTLVSYTITEEESRLVNLHQIFGTVCSLHLKGRSNPKQPLKQAVTIMDNNSGAYFTSCARL
jgi:hypothetical protein